MLIESLDGEHARERYKSFVYIFFNFILFIQGTSSSRLVFFIVFYATDSVRALYGG